MNAGAYAIPLEKLLNYGEVGERKECAFVETIPTKINFYTYIENKVKMYSEIVLK